MKNTVEIIGPGSFEAENHYYPKALNSQIHSLVNFFFHLNHDRIINRYAHLNPAIDPHKLKEVLEYYPKYFYWGGADLFYVTTKAGNRKMVVLETNSCPSGQKSMPSTDDPLDQRGFRRLIEESFLPALKNKRLPKGELAVIYDKNYMEASGYAAMIAELTGENVLMVPHYNEDEQHITFEDGILYAKRPDTNEHVPVRAAFKYVTQKPWNRIPIHTKTFIYNPILVCLAGGRNKLVANKAYEFFNSEIADSGLKINYPETIRDVAKNEVPLWVHRFGGYAVVKVPYGNAGQGVFTITNDKELDDFMKIEHGYDQFIVQSLIGHYEWSSHTSTGKFYHIGTVPNKKGKIHVADLRMMIYSSPEGFKPAAIYARRSRIPLEENLKDTNSWDVLGTNLSIKKGPNQWDSDTSRLMLMDRKDFNTLGIGIDDLIEAYIQAVLSVVAIDKMACQLIGSKGQFKIKLFQSLDRDESLLKELVLK